MNQTAVRNTTQRSFLQQFWRKFRRNPLNLMGMGILLFMVFLAVAAPLLAPYDPTRKFGATGDQFHPLPPFSSGEEGRLFVLGTDQLGADVLSNLIYGARTALEVGLGVVLVAALVGIMIGGLAGYNRDTWIDQALMRPMDIFISFPSLVLAIGIIGVMGTGATQIGPVSLPHLVKLMVAIGVGYVPRFARIMRGSVVAELNNDYVAAAQVLGASHWRILGGEIMPNAISPVIVQATLRMGSAILLAAGLSFLGLGVQPPTPSWGVMLSESRGYIISGEWWLPVFPGLLIFITILGFNLMGDGLRDAIDPTYDPDQPGI